MDEKPINAEITEAQQKALAAVAPLLDSNDYLAGGVAVAAWLGHRTSRDLDLFSYTTDPAQLADAFAQMDSVRITSRAEGTLYMDVHGVPVSLIRYHYPLLGHRTSFEHLAVPVADMKDLVCMKLSAIASRGAVRDFWDLHGMLVRRSDSIDTALGLFRSKYDSEDIGHVIRSLVYFGDADAEPLPSELAPEHWTRIKEDFRTWVKAV